MPDPVTDPTDHGGHHDELQGVQQADDNPGHEPGRHHHDDESGDAEDGVAGE
jgi:hypothetical protein